MKNEKMYHKLMKWLKSGSNEMCMVEIYCSQNAYFRHQLKEGLDILYVYKSVKDGIIPIHSDPEYQGIYERKSGLLYDVQYYLREIVSEEMYEPRTFETLRSELEEEVRSMVEKEVSKFEGDIKLDESTLDIQKYYECSAEDIARKMYLNERAEEFGYECYYDESEFEKKFIRYILDKENVIKETANQYIKEQHEGIIKDIVLNMMTKIEFDKLQKGENTHLTTMKNIIASIPRDCKTVNVTTLIDGKGYTFKYDALQLRCDCGSHYYTWFIPAKERKEFERIYGRNQDFTPCDITKITYCRNVLYEKDTA